MKTMSSDENDANSPAKLNSKYRNSVKSLHNYNPVECQHTEDALVQREPFARLPKRIGTVYSVIF